MAKSFNRALKLAGESVQIGTPVVKVLEFDVDNNVLRATGATLPTDGDRGYAVGCTFIKTDGGTGTVMYVNEGTATSADFNVAVRGVDNVEVVTATNVITAAESGKTFFLDAAAGFESTLPTAAAGLHLRFIVKTAPTSNGYTITGSPADKIYGTVAASGAEATINGVTASAADNVILVANQATVGDLVEFDSDGTNWYVTGNVNTYAAITANG